MFPLVTKRSTLPTRQGALKLNPEPMGLRQRLLEAAAELFYKYGIRGVGVEAIAGAAGTNKMTLYRHFGSKDELVAAWLRQLVNEMEGSWDQIAVRFRHSPKDLLLAWFEFLAAGASHFGERGCPFANSLAELPERNHPARLPAP